MPIFTVPFADTGVNEAQELFSLTAPANSKLLIHEVRFGQRSDAGDAAAELLTVTFTRGDTGAIAGGVAVTPVNLRPESAAPAAGATATRNSTTLADGGSTIWADVWNIQSPFLWLPPLKSAPVVVAASQRFSVRITAPVDGLTTSGTLTFEEIGTRHDA